MPYTAKSLLTISFLMLLFSCFRKANQKTNDPANDPIKVMTYNIHHANPPSKPDLIDLAAIAKVINQEQPDLVALQEIDVNNTRSGKTMHQANELGRLTNMQSFFAKGIDYGGGEYGVALLSRFPMEDMQLIPLPTEESTKGEHRTLGTAVISLANGDKILFGVTHLDAQREPTNRLLQIKAIVQHFKTTKLPVIVAGDFNATAGTEVIKILDSTFKRTCEENCGFTIPQINANKTIDFIAFKPGTSFQVIEHKVIQEPYASDHLPVVSVLRFSR